MSYRVQCSACGKVMVLGEATAGERLVCVACGARLEAPPPPILEARDAEPDADILNTALAAAGASATGRGAAHSKTSPARGTSRTTTVLIAAGVSLAVVAVAALVVATLLYARGNSGRARQPGDRTVTSAEMRANADLLTLKSEAEALAIDGNLAAAHEKYRSLQQLAVGRDIKDPLLWDIMERAKLDQDNIYMLLLRRQIPPGENPGAAFIVPPYVQLPTAVDSPSTGSAAASAPRADSAAGSPGDGTAPSGNGDQSEVAEAADSADEGGAVTQPVAASQPNSPTLVAHVAPPAALTDEQVGESMQKGVDFLLARIRDGQIAPLPDAAGIKQDGINALVVYALLTSGQAMNDERLDVRGEFMKLLIDKMKAHELKARRGDPQQPITYARSLRAAALAVYNRPEDRKVLKADVDWLVGAALNGAYTYDDQLARSPTARAEEAPDAAPAARASAEASRFPEQVLRAGAMHGGDDWSGDSPPQPAGLWYDDGSTDVLPTHGIHDAQGRELYVPLVPLPGRHLTPLPPGYPPRAPTQRPGVRVPTRGTGIPPGVYDNRRGMGDMPVETPGRDGAAGSLSSAFPWDNSNSQYGLLGVWAGAEVGVEVPVRYWKDVEKHWTETQLSGGEWGYTVRDRAGSFAMTCGGLASLFVTHDWLAAPALKDTGRDPLTPAMAAGLGWLERGNNAITTPNPKTHYVGYDLFGLERVGLASGFKYFGKHDWYRELAANALGTQWPTGAWGREPDGADAIIDTAYTLLFFARGRHPILMNKLRFQRSEVTRLDGKPQIGYWSNRPRDLANLTRFASRQLERGLNWQVASLQAPWHDWLDAPILYIASHQAPALEDSDYQNLRSYVEAGGILFTHADTGAAAFNRWVGKLVEYIAPGRALENLPEDHPVYTVNYKSRSPRPRLQGVSNGSRLLVVHSPTDLSTQWQQRNERIGAETFRLGVNLFVYSAGKSGFRNRLSSPYVPEPKSEPQGVVPVARLKYEGNWDPEPGAWGRFGRVFQWQTSFATDIRPVEMKALQASTDVRVAHLTGNALQVFTDAEVTAVRAFVENGGTLLVDACGGSAGFYESVSDGLLARAFPAAKPEKPAADHPIFVAAGEKVSLSPKLRPFTPQVLEDGTRELRIFPAGAGHVVVSPIDLTSGLLGTNTWGIAGYEPGSAQAIVRNTLLWAQARPHASKQ